MVTKPTPFKAAAPIDLVKGKTNKEKLAFIANTFGCYEGYTGKVIQEFRKEKKKLMVIYFDNKDQLFQAIDIPIKNPIKDGEGFTEYKFQLIEEIRKPKTTQEIFDIKSQTIQVLDIPLNTPAAAVRAVFSRFGDIDTLSMTTRSIYQQAFIKYKGLNCKDHFRDMWATYIERHMVRIIPLTLNEDERDERKQHCLKLTGFRKGTTSRDLYEILNLVKAKSCFI